MSTNYYVTASPCEHPCQHCSQESKIHLGKSSIGWTFSFRSYRDPGELPGIPAVTDFASWLRLLDLGPISDEYQQPVTREELLALIDAKRGGRSTLYRGDFTDADGNRFIPEYFS